MPKFVNVIERTPVGYEKIAVTTLSVSQLTPALVEDAKAVFITIESNPIRYRIDGGNPDIDDGHLVYEDQNIWFENSEAIRNFRSIAIGGNSTLIITYYR